jgi:hypothetical protein
MEILRRVDAPVLGAVLIGATDTPTAYRYYTDRYYSSDVDEGRGRSTKDRATPGAMSDGDVDALSLPSDASAAADESDLTDPLEQTDRLDLSRPALSSEA